MTTRRLYLSAALLFSAATAQAQLISVKTIPIAQADQFQLFPSRAIGMGGLSIALADTIADGGANPAKGARYGVASFFSSPYTYSVTQNGGGGRTLPMGFGMKKGNWFGSFSGALQELDFIDERTPPTAPFDFTGNPIPVDNGSRGNKFLFGSAGKTLSQSGWSLGASAFWAEIHAIDGVDRLYANSQSVRQFGHAVDFRAGALREWSGGQSFEAVLVHNRIGMTHDVTFTDQFFDPAIARNGTRARVDRNIDHTNVWGLHFGYERPLGHPGLRVGAILTANRMSHPKIPEYRIEQVVQTIPWDPGHTNAFNLGVGAVRTEGPATMGVNLILEPIWTHTWGEAQAPTVDRFGVTIPAGGRTVENWFHFLNTTIRLGLDRRVIDRNAPTESSPWRMQPGSFQANVQLGLNVHTVHYKFWQNDRVQVAGRSSTEGWTQWSPTWGLRIRFPEMELRYQGHVTMGLGRPGPLSSGGDVRIANGFSGDLAGDAIVSPPSEGSGSMGEVSLFTHQVSISFPLGSVK